MLGQESKKQNVSNTKQEEKITSNLSMLQKIKKARGLSKMKKLVQKNHDINNELSRLFNDDEHEFETREDMLLFSIVYSNDPTQPVKYTKIKTFIEMMFPPIALSENEILSNAIDSATLFFNDNNGKFLNHLDDPASDYKMLNKAVEVVIIENFSPDEVKMINEGIGILEDLKPVSKSENLDAFS
jgi:hypothetical protein